jgi:uncharacterized phage-like protein YoqJ
MIIAGTGHRPDKLFRTDCYGDAPRLRLEAFAETILREIDAKVVVSGMALGWDQAIAEAALRIGIQLVAALPFGGQENRWPLAAQERYRALLKRATIKLVCDGDYAAWKLQRRNQYLVTSSDLLLALWNGSDGGTANCVGYADRVGRKMQDMPAALIAAADRDHFHGGGMTNVWSRWIAEESSGASGAAQNEEG